MPARKTVSPVIARYWRRLYEEEDHTVGDIVKMSTNLGYPVSKDTVRKVLAKVGTFLFVGRGK